MRVEQLELRSDARDQNDENDLTRCYRGRRGAGAARADLILAGQLWALIPAPPDGAAPHQLHLSNRTVYLE